jgi:hypothetical protein
VKVSRRGGAFQAGVAVESEISFVACGFVRCASSENSKSESQCYRYSTTSFSCALRRLTKTIMSLIFAVFWVITLLHIREFLEVVFISQSHHNCLGICAHYFTFSTMAKLKPKRNWWLNLKPFALNN